MKWISDLMFKKAVADGSAAERRTELKSRGPVEIQADSPILSAIVGGGIDGSG